MKQLVILAGGNGSGKSSYFNEYLRDSGIHFINADEIAKRHFPNGTTDDSKNAQEYARTLCNDYLESGQHFCFETVFSHESKLELIKKAKTLGYTVELIYIHLQHYQLNQARVIHRVSHGGHPVPFDRIKSRIPRTFANIKEALKLVDTARILDNSLAIHRFKVMTTIKNQEITYLEKPSPKWVSDLLKGF